MSKSEAAPTSGKPTWLRMYNALGAFSVLSVLSAVGLGGAILNLYQDSVAESKIQAERSAAYASLSRIATLANGPGNDVFENRDIPGERAKLDAYEKDFKKAYAEAREEIGTNVPAELQPEMLAQLDASNARFDELTGFARAIFASFEKGDVDAAGSNMAQMDRKLAETSEALAGLATMVQDQQASMFATQLGVADKFQYGAYGILGLVVAMVGGVVAYGQQLARIFAAAQAEIARRRREVTLLLENVDQGLVTVDANGKMSTERSNAFEQLFGSVVESLDFKEQLEVADPVAAQWFEVTWESIRNADMPDELLVEQLPRGFVRGDVHVALRYRILRNGEELKGLLVIASDVTAEVERARAEVAQRQTLALFERISSDRLAVVEYMADADRIVRTIQAAVEELSVEKRLLHTLKGNSGFFGLSTLVDVCHQLESKMEDSGEALEAHHRAELVSAWEQVRRTATQMLGGKGEGKLEIADSELKSVLQAVLDRRPYGEIARRIAELKMEPVARRFERLSEQARALGQRLGKGEVQVSIEGGELRGDPKQTAAFFSSLVHVIRNAVDHGWEDSDSRIAAGKAEALGLKFAARTTDQEVVIELVDDGKGIDWARIRQKAAEKGVSPLREAETHELLFLDGLSTRDEVSEISGRGVGLGAVRAEVERLWGRVEVESQLGKGTTFRFRIPKDSWVSEAIAC